jgi:type III restriction enzyme
MVSVRAALQSSIIFPGRILSNLDSLVLAPEVKGFEDGQDRAKHEAAKRWCRTVSAWGEMGKWEFDVCEDPKKLEHALARYKK